MMDAVLMSMVWLVETVVNYALGAVLIALALVGAAAACRWLLSCRTGAAFGAAAGPALVTLTALVAVGTFGSLHSPG